MDGSDKCFDRLQSLIQDPFTALGKSLLAPRAWRYWHDELGETSWPLQERNLTYAGRLATFIGFYIDAFGEPPADRIELDGRSISYAELSESLHTQMIESPTCGVSCYHHQSMVMCNAHMLINNVLHDRLFSTNYSDANMGWMTTVDDHLMTNDGKGALFFFGTNSDDPSPIEEKTSVGADIWALFLMSSVEPDRVRSWFEGWQHNITYEADRAYADVSPHDYRAEFSSRELATAWTFCLARELGQAQRADLLAVTLRDSVVKGFERDPLISGLYLLGEELDEGAFHRLVTGRVSAT